MCGEVREVRGWIEELGAEWGAVGTRCVPVLDLTGSHLDEPHTHLHPAGRPYLYSFCSAHSVCSLLSHTPLNVPRSAAASARFSRRLGCQVGGGAGAAAHHRLPGTAVCRSTPCALAAGWRARHMGHLCRFVCTEWGGRHQRRSLPLNWCRYVDSASSSGITSQHFSAGPSLAQPWQRGRLQRPAAGLRQPRSAVSRWWRIALAPGFVEPLCRIASMQHARAPDTRGFSSSQTLGSCFGETWVMFCSRFALQSWTYGTSLRRSSVRGVVSKAVLLRNRVACPKGDSS